MRRRYGFTLIEIMVTIGIVLTMVAATSTLVVGGMRSTQQATAYTGDVLGMRRAVRFLEHDLRAATTVTLPGSADVLRLQIAEDTVVYHLRSDRKLLRIEAGQSQDLLGNLAALRAQREGRCLALYLELSPRTARPTRLAVLETRVFLRNLSAEGQ